MRLRGKLCHWDGSLIKGQVYEIRAEKDHVISLAIPGEDKITCVTRLDAVILLLPVRVRQPLFMGSGDRSGANCYRLVSGLVERLQDIGGTQQFGLQGENITPAMEDQLEDAEHKNEQLAADVLESLTGLRLLDYPCSNLR